MMDEKKLNKNSKEYILDMAETTINELVRPKYAMRRQYEYYYGVRNAEQYRYLEENFGIGNPTSVEFTPLIKNHIDYLVGEYLSEPVKLKIKCKDKETLSKIELEKDTTKLKAAIAYNSKAFKDMFNQFRSEGKADNKFKEEDRDKQKESSVANFISSYEKAGQDVLEYIQQSKNIGFAYKRQQLTLDLLIAGMNFYRVSPTRSKDNLRVEIHNPQNVFYDKTPDSPYVSDCRRIVVRKWMTKYQILSEYGDLLTVNDVNDIDEKFNGYDSDYAHYVYAMPGVPFPLPGTFDDDTETVPGYPYDKYTKNEDHLIPVYEIEWLDYDKNDGTDKRIKKSEYEYVTYRYRCIRIGADIYIPIGKDDVYDRTSDNLSECKLSYGGIFLLDRTDRPYSLVRTCMHLQDKYDVTCFIRDAAIARSGSVGSWVDVAQLPSFLGTDMVERIEKYDAYKKAGMAIIDSSQDGVGSSPNTVYTQYDETIKSDFIEGINTVLAKIEEDLSKITGVYSSVLGKADQYQVATQREEIRAIIHITKRYYTTMDTSTECLMLSALNVAKVVWPKGKRGSIFVGDNMTQFEALPEHYTVTDYDLQIHSTADSIDESSRMDTLVKTLLQSQALDASYLPDIVASKSLTDLSQKLKEAIAKKTKTEETISKLQQENEQAKQQIEQLTQKNQEMEKNMERYNMEKIKAERLKDEEEMKFKYYDANQKAEIEKQKLEFEKKKEGIR